MRDEHVQDIVNGHLEWWDEQENEQRLFEAMYETRFWNTHHFENGRWALRNEESGEGGLPVKVEASRLWVWLNTFTSHLFLRQPRAVARLPGVLAPRAGRPRNLRELPERVEALVDEWLSRSEVQELATYAYQLALMSGACALKMGVDPTASASGDVLDRVWLTVCPRWECLWDDRAATPQQQLFRGHLTHVLDVEAERIVGEPLPENWERSRLPRLYLHDEADRGGTLSDKVHPERYVRLLEFYDFEAEEQRFYLLTCDARNPQLVPYGKAEKIPYRMPSGECGCPIFPVVLDNTPKHPMRGIPSARRIWRLTAEDNYIGSFVASAARRRMALKGVYNKSKLADDKVGDWWRSPEDLELLGVEAGDLEQLVKFIEPPPLDPALADAQAWVSQARRDTEGLTPQMQGQQGQYLTAAEAEMVAEGGEATAGQIASRMVRAIAGCAQMLLTIVAEHQPKVNIIRGTEVVTLTREQLRMPWRLRILDAGTTPSREAARKREWGLIEPQIEKLVTLASGVPDPSGAVVPPPEPLRRFTRAALRYTRQVYDLPEDFSPESLLDGAEPEEAEEVTEEVPVPDPMALAAPPPELAHPMMAPLPPGPVAPMAPPPPLPPPAPAGPQLVTDSVSGMTFDATTGALLDPTTGEFIPLPPDPGAMA